MSRTTQRQRWLILAILALVAIMATSLSAPHVANATSTTWTVSPTSDSNGLGSCDTVAHTCPTLRDAINNVTVVSGDTIIFSGDGTITLTNGTLTIGKSLTIDGGAHKVAIDGSGNQIFNITSGTINLRNLTLQNGSAGSNLKGGAVFVSSGSALNVTGSTFVNNSAGFGGAIYNNGGTVLVAASTFYKNVASEAGAIGNNGSLHVISSTIYKNQATGTGSTSGGGGIDVGSGSTTTTIDSSILQANVGGDCQVNGSKPLSGIDNIIDLTNLANSTCTGVLTSVGASTVLDSSGSNSGLNDNGGPTSTFALIGPSSNSIAIDKASSCAYPAAFNSPPNFFDFNKDQRGLARPIGPTNKCDIGAFEAFAFNPSSLSQHGIVGANLNLTLPSIGITGGTGNIGYTIGAVLPIPSWSLNVVSASNTGQLTGIPTTVQGSPFAITVNATDSNSMVGKWQYSLTIDRADTSITVANSTGPNNPVYGQPVSFKAQVTAKLPSSAGVNEGSVTFYEGLPTTTPLGTVNVDSAGNATLICGPSNASCPTVLSVASHIIYAVYNPANSNPNFNTSTTSNPTQTYTVTVNQAPTKTTVTVHGSPPQNGFPVTYDANVFKDPSSLSQAAFDDGGSVTFALDGTNINGCINIALSSMTVNGVPPGHAYCTFTAQAGNHTITAAYSGDTNFAGSSVGPIPSNVAPADTTISVSLTSPSSNPVFGQPVTFTAGVIVNSPSMASLTLGDISGLVTFSDGGTNITCDNLSYQVTAFQNNIQSSALVMCTINAGLSVGTHSNITASYVGDIGFVGHTSNPLMVTVSKAGTTPTITQASPASPFFGQPVTFTANVMVASPGAGTPTGTLSYFADSLNNPAFATCTLNQGSPDQCTSSPSFAGLTAGLHNIYVRYSGDGNFNGSDNSSAPFSLTVQQAVTKTSTSLSSNNNPADIGQPVTYLATVITQPPGAGIPDGSVTFNDSFNGNTINTVTVALSPGANSSATASFTTSYPESQVGKHIIVAKYSGSANFQPSASDPLTETVRGCAIYATVKTSMQLGVAASSSGGVQFITFRTPSGSLVVRIPITILACSFTTSATASVSGIADSVKGGIAAPGDLIRVDFMPSEVDVVDVTSKVTYKLTSFQFGTVIKINALS